MAVTTRRRKQENGSLQPVLFRPEALTLPARCEDERCGQRPLSQEGGRAGRLFSLAQRSNMRGVHERRSAPVPGKRYAASIVVSRAGGLGSAAMATVTIGELSGDGGALLVVDHERVGVDGQLALAGLVASVERTWGCDPTLSLEGKGPAAHGGLAEMLRNAAANGGVRVYQPDGSRERRDFEAQVVGARARLGEGGFVLDNGPRDDAYVVGLGLLLQAAERGAIPARRAA